VIAVAAPGSAATTPLAYADSNALNLSLLGSPISTGTVVSTTDGKTTTTSGNSAPTIQALGGQSLIPSTGVLVQNSKASMSGTDGVSQSCAGLAGAGGQLVAIGNGDCIKGGQQLALDPGSVALGGINLASAGILKPISDALANAGVLGCASGNTSSPLSLTDITALLTALNLTSLTGLIAGTTTCDSLVNAIAGGLTPALQNISATIGLHLNLGAVSAWCTATPTTVAGNGNVAGASLVATVAGQNITVLNLPVNPAPNTHVLTNLDKVVSAVQAGIVTQLDSLLQGTPANAIGAALAPIVNQVLGTINTQIVAQLAPQLAPLEQNILDGVLNAQSSTGTANHSIATGSGAHSTNSVTALDLKVLPVLGAQQIELRVGKVDCGPNYTANNVTPPQNCQQAHNCPPAPPSQCSGTNCPTHVTSGLAAGYLPSGPLGMALLGLTVAAAAGAGVTAGARALRKSA
jgi:hypothetical protein